ncbi:hypothetical protein [Flavobacterium sp. TAB 87]|uniref:hypothetical protein n=1 Tax=Flavobacterium sp. TAB 87 TaxID=1729581 RepID=UPI00076C005E|nr:hypothetical protein [Flavobacterium sp. TAB 87]KVV14831.1 hypothetical protein AP058_01887 [Flavobacterium sp. TAB 87]
MTTEIINQRLEDLHNVLLYCSEVDRVSYGKDKVFSTGERITINQERGSYFSQLAANNGEIFPHEVRTYQVTEHIDNKINKTLEQIHATSWGGFTNDKFLK